MDSFETAWVAGLLGNGPRWLRKHCARELGNSGDARAVAPLCAVLNDEAIGEVVIQALVQLGEPAVLPLCQALKDEDRVVRCRAAEALGKIMDPRAVQPLSETLADKKWSVRAQAIKALGEIGDPHGAPPLIELLGHQEWSLRAQAIEALGRIGDPRAAPPLIELLKYPDWDTRRQAAGALEEIGRPAVPLLCEALKSDNGRVRAQAAAILGRIGDVRAILPLCDALRQGQMKAAAALRAIATRAPAPDLRTALPLLCERARYVPDGAEGGETVRVAFTAIRRIEAAAAAMRKLPIPAAAPLPSAEGLPVPAGLLLPSVESLPVAAGPPALPGKESTPYG